MTTILLFGLWFAFVFPVEIRTTEDWCACLGELTRALVVDRDQGVPLHVTLQHIQLAMTELWRRTGHPEGATVYAGMMEKMAVDLYPAQHITPQQARAAVIQGCLTVPNPPEVLGPGQREWRLEQAYRARTKP